MEHIFIVNPTAGQGKRQKGLIETLSARGISHYVTKAPQDAEDYIKRYCKENPEKKIRFYACGGDGTLNEVLNGVYGFDNAEISSFPVGSGNDYVRNFDVETEFFRDIDRQIAGSAVPVDIIEYENGETKRFAINMFNIGFDCNVAYNMSRVKKYPLVRDSFAYILAIAVALIKKDGASLKISFDDGTDYAGNVLLTAVSNGCYCGGGVKCLPLAVVDDGLIDVTIVKDISRRAILSFFPKYSKGGHLDDEEMKKIIIYKKCNNLSVLPLKGKVRICADGEVEDACSEVSFRIIHKAVMFSLPKSF